MEVVVEVRIGVQNTAREVVVESSLSAAEVAAAVSKAIADGSVLTLNDEKGRQVLIPAAGISYVDIAATEVRKIGFGS